MATTAAAAGNAIAAVQITPALAIDYADNAQITVRLAEKALSCASPKDAFAIVMASRTTASYRPHDGYNVSAPAIAGRSRRSAMASMTSWMNRASRAEWS